MYIEVVLKMGYNYSINIMRSSFMTVIFIRIITYAVAIICFFSSLFGIADAKKIIAKEYEIMGSGSCEVGNGRVSIHDPSIIQNEDGTYYIFGTDVPLKVTI